MHIDPNDPRLIDYALGELDPGEAATLQAALQDPENIEALRAVRDFQQLAGTARQALAEEPAPALDAPRREAVQHAARQAAAPRPARRVAPWAAALAASVALGFGLLLYGVTGLQRAEQTRLATVAQERVPAAPANGAENLAALPHDLRRQLDALGYLDPPTPAEADDAGQQPAPMVAEAAPDPAPFALADTASPPPPAPEIAAAPAPTPPPAPPVAQEPAPAKSAPPVDQAVASAPTPPATREAASALATSAPAAPAPVSAKVGQATPGRAAAAPPASAGRPAIQGGELALGTGEAFDARVLELLSATGYFEGGGVAMPPPPQHWAEPSREGYRPIAESGFLETLAKPLSTFSIDVDTGAYAIVRRFLQQGQLPPRDAVRIEEMINYFNYTLPQPTDGRPFSVGMELSDCPWAPDHKLARVALQGKTVTAEERGAANLVFLIDVSGSMSGPNRLPLVRESMKALLEQLEPRDRVAIVTYASGTQTVLPSTPCTDKTTIRAAIDGLTAGGSTHGSGGIVEAYRIAREHFIPGGVNRVLLATDGDFNVGVTSHDALMDLIAEQAKSKVFLTVLGFGMGNYQDGMLEQLANKGNGNYAYIDTFSEARRVLVGQMQGTLVTIAKDVKIQVEFNPAHVRAYRLIGYENRALADRDFNDDTKDAGEIGAGHQVTALYQLVPVGAPLNPGVDPLRYQAAAEAPSPPNDSPEWMTVKLRYKQPEGDVSDKIELAWSNPGGTVEAASPDHRFAAAVAAFGMVLRGSEHKGGASYDQAMALAESGKGGAPERQAFIDLVVGAKTLSVR